MSEIRARLDKASDDIGLAYRIPADEWEVTCDKGTSQLLTHAPSDIRWLLGEVERLTARIEAIAQEIEAKRTVDEDLDLGDSEGFVRGWDMAISEAARIARGGDPS